MGRRRMGSSKLSLFRWILPRLIAALTFGAILAVHLFPSSDPADEQLVRWKQEPSPPLLSKLSTSPDKVDAFRKPPKLDDLWNQRPHRNFLPCLNPNSPSTAPKRRGFLLVHTNGGLNQMRAGISDMVAIARIINATLVIPKLDKKSFWQDSSNFSDVFNQEHFIRSLENDVRVIKKLPKSSILRPRAVKYFTSWASYDYYRDEVSQLWKKYKVIKAAKSDSRLANNDLPREIQRLRCRVFFEALRFAPRIEAFGNELVKRMRSYGRYIALHLRYEKDMLAFSGCSYGLSRDEADELTKIRESTAHWVVKNIDPVDRRSKGACPLTPKEVGIFLTALGYSRNTPIYVAAGEIYGGDARMADLRRRFPMLLDKEMLTSAEELEPFMPYASRLAALDYIVSLESDVFVPSYSGNMARAVAGHRRYLGHRKTISPDRKMLVSLFDKIDRGELQEGPKLSNMVVGIHKKRLGTPRKRKGPISGTRGKERFRSEEAFYENPLPECLCSIELSNSNRSLSSVNST